MDPLSQGVLGAAAPKSVAPPEQARIAALFGFLAGKEEFETTVSTERTGTRRDTEEFLAIEVKDLRSGLYELLIQIVDYQSGEIFTRTIQVELE